MVKSNYTYIFKIFLKFAQYPNYCVCYFMFITYIEKVFIWFTSSSPTVSFIINTIELEVIYNHTIIKFI